MSCKMSCIFSDGADIADLLIPSAVVAGSLAVSPSELKKQAVVLKEDVMFQVRLHFYVQREIVQGLKYIQRTYKTGIRGTL